MKNKITSLFNIKHPIIQAGMIWCSGWELASAVSNAGGLGIIGSGSMYPDILKEHILKCKKNTVAPFAVNLPLLYPNAEDHIKSIIDYNSLDSVTRAPYGQGIFEGIIKNTMSKTDFKLLKEKLN